ncbi:class I SAM-dependent methyltransferase [Kineococcus sp. SYSU DK006]|uniref:class I SAM-dependent methyltransferase n=1 Tax=Kineococcus sp. SYSU DK006 TaxID=3383127 RepID=UPI003D7C5CD5
MQGIGEVFDRAAGGFRRLGPLLWDPIGERTAAAARPRPGERVLDACCGDGASALPAAVAVGPQGHVDAVDLSLAMVSALTGRASGLPQLHVHCADVTRWEGGGYDVVQCALGVFFLPDMDAGTEHLIRCARPGGRVVTTVWNRGALASAGAALFTAVARHREGLRPPASSSRSRRIATAEDLAGWLGARGLHQVRVDLAPHRVPSTPEALWALVVGSGFSGLLDGLDDAALEAVRGEYLDALAGGPPVDASTLVGVGTAGGPR